METARQKRPSAVREKLIESASRLFYDVGIHATSADRIIADVGTTKATFYRHFPSKDDLVLAYLDATAAAERAEMGEAAAAADADEALRDVVHVLGSAGCDTGFRGCPFINAAAEYPDADHRVRTFIAGHRAWWHDYFRALAERLGVPAGDASDAVAGQLLMLRDGALFTGYVDDPDHVEARLREAVESVLAGRRVRGG